MKYLLDTCTLLWLSAEPRKLSTVARDAIDAPDSVLNVSAVSALELTLKWAKGKIKLPDPPRRWFEEQTSTWELDCLPLSRSDIYLAGELPEHHQDPFDRLLIATALNAGATLLTPDAAIRAYAVSWRW